MNTNNPEFAKYAIEVHLAEFAALRDEVNVQIEIQNSLVKSAITVIGATITLIAIGESTLFNQQPFLLLVGSILLSSIGIAMIDASFQMNDISDYVHRTLRQKIQAIVGGERSKDFEVFSWETARIYKGSRLFWKAVMALGKYFMVFIPSILFIIVFLSYAKLPVGSWQIHEKVLFWISIAVALLSLGASVHNGVFILGFRHKKHGKSDEYCSKKGKKESKKSA